MKKILIAALLICSVKAKANPIAGKLDLTSTGSVGLWQSVNSPDQAIGLSKRLFHVDYAGQSLINISVFAGGTKPMLSEPGAPVRFLAGDVIAVPGSTLDWALGTKLGDTWLPRLKTGVLLAHDMSRIKSVRLFKPDFIGVGAAWPFGSPN